MEINRGWGKSKRIKQGPATVMGKAIDTIAAVLY